MNISNAAAACFALFVFAGYYKAADFLQFIPIDLTLLLAVAALALCISEIWRTRSLGPGVIAMLAMFVTLAIGFRWPEEFGSYATQKELRLFSLTALSAFAPLVLLRTETRRLAFVYTACLIGLVMAGVAAVETAQHGLSARATIFNTNPILLARASGFAGLVLCLLYWQGRLKAWAFTPAVLLALFGLVASGTKAPLLGVFLAALVTASLIMTRDGARRQVWASLVLGCAGLFGALAYLTWIGAYVARRIGGPLTGEWGFAGETRLALWRQTLELMPMHPLGLGWGGFSERINIFENKTLMQHPHNIALEVFIEAGWLAGATFLALLALIAYRSLKTLYRAPTAARHSASADLLLVFAGLLYWVICAAFSGDVNDNRPLWAVIGMTLAALGRRGFVERSGREDTSKVGNAQEPPPGT